MNRARWIGLLLAAQGCAPSPGPSSPEVPLQVPPQAPPEAPPEAPAPPQVTASAAASAVPVASGWAAYQAPSKRRKMRSDAFDECVAEMREGAWLGNDPAAQTYQEALEDEGARKLDSARRGYLQVIQRFPASPYVPLTYLAFGELFAAEALDDPTKWALAQQTYQKVIEYPPTVSGIFAYAQLRLGEVFLRQNDAAHALAMSRSAVLSARDARQRCPQQIQLKGVTQTVEAYAVTGTPARAFSFFRTMFRDDDDSTLAVGLLADFYTKSGRRAEACKAVSALPPSQQAGYVMTFCAAP